jgi:hypothetical protein
LLRKAHVEASSLNAKLPKVEEKAQPQSSQPTTEPSTQKG